MERDDQQLGQVNEWATVMCLMLEQNVWKIFFFFFFLRHCIRKEKNIFEKEKAFCSVKIENKKHVNQRCHTVEFHNSFINLNDGSDEK